MAKRVPPASLKPEKNWTCSVVAPSKLAPNSVRSPRSRGGGRAQPGAGVGAHNDVERKYDIEEVIHNRGDVGHIRHLPRRGARLV